MAETKCEICSGKMVKIEQRTIGDTKYDILKCEKCKHILARSVE